MNTACLPPADAMWAAFVTRDAAFDGLFVAAVRTTGIYCRPTCPARTPKRDNVEFFADATAARTAGYRACKRCRPDEAPGAIPSWLQPLVERVDAEPEQRVTDADIRALGIDPSRVRRWYRVNHGTTFHREARARRLGIALDRIRGGDDSMGVAFDVGWESVSAFRDAFGARFGRTPGASRDAARVAVARLTTPLGPMLAGASDDGVCLLEFDERPRIERQTAAVARHLGCVFAPDSHPHIDTLRDELDAWFAGERTGFTTPLALAGTPFERAVWHELQRIPHGETRSYDAIARALGKPGASRAVGRANGANRIAIVVPCHRVVRADGALGGYGGGLWRKRRLLAIEGAR